MNRFSPTVLALILTMVVSTTAFGGNIAGGRAAGHIAGGRTAGNIAGGRASGNIAGGRSATVQSPPVINAADVTNGTSRLDFDAGFSGTIAGLIRMLLESGALL